MRFLDTSRIRTRFDQRVRAGDGVELSVDLYLPTERGRYPILLNRTPADNNRDGRAGITVPSAERWKALAAQGFIVAACDVRGRGDSDGAFVPFVNEAADGAATISWLRTLGECNGKIGLFGSGYSAFCAWAAAVADRNVDAVASISPFGAVGSGFVHRGGAVRLDWLFWMHLIAGRTVQPASVPRWSTIYSYLPLNALEEALGREDVWWREWMEHLDPADTFWASLRLADKIAALKIPGLHISGWWDGQVEGAHYYYEAASRGAPQLFIIGPWDTAATRRSVRNVGGFDFGPRSVLDMDEMLSAFFRTVLQAVDDTPGPSTWGEASQLRSDDAPPMKGSRVFVTGYNKWVACENWPKDSATELQLYFNSTLGANTRCGDGSLAREPANKHGADVITHNPAQPINFQPLFSGFAAGTNPLGFTLDQAHITSRDEALVYTSAPMEQPVTIFGRPKVKFTVLTSAPDADVYVLLSDCFPLGVRDLHLCHAAVRLATLSSFKPGVPLQVELECNSIAHGILVGHQIRLTVIPSLFPLYARNLHAPDYTGSSEPAITDLKLCFGPSVPASLTLPLA